jgi:hypothetical protein
LKKSGKLASYVLSSINAINSSPTGQISLRIVALFKKIYDGKPILTVFSVSSEDLQHCCFIKVYYLRTRVATSPIGIVDAMFENPDPGVKKHRISGPDPQHCF